MTSTRRMTTSVVPRSPSTPSMLQQQWVKVHTSSHSASDRPLQEPLSTKRTPSWRMWAPVNNGSYYTLGRSSSTLCITTQKWRMQWLAWCLQKTRLWSIKNADLVKNSSTRGSTQFYRFHTPRNTNAVPAKRHIFLCHAKLPSRTPEGLHIIRSFQNVVTRQAKRLKKWFYKAIQLRASTEFKGSPLCT